MLNLTIIWILCSLCLAAGWAARALLCEPPPADPPTIGFTYDQRGRVVVLPVREILEAEAHHNQN